MQSGWCVRTLTSLTGSSCPMTSEPLTNLFNKHCLLAFAHHEARVAGTRRVARARHADALRSTCGARLPGPTHRTPPSRSTSAGTSRATRESSRQSRPSTCALRRGAPRRFQPPADSATAGANEPTRRQHSPGGAMILIFIVDGASAVSSFCMRSAMPGNIVEPPERTVLP